MKVPIIRLKIGDKFRSFPKYPEEEIIDITEYKVVVKLHNGAITEYDKKGLVHIKDEENEN